MDTNELLTFILNHAVLILTLVFLAFMIITGYKIGFFDKIISLGSLLVTLILEIRLFPYVMAWMQQNETVRGLFTGLARSVMQLDRDIPDSPLYRILGIDLLADNAAQMIENVAARVLCFLVIFIAVRILMGFAARLFDWLRKIRLVDSADRLLGAVFGAAEALLLMWVFMLVISGLPANKYCGAVLAQIEASPLLRILYDRNLLMMYAGNIFGSFN